MAEPAGKVAIVTAGGSGTGRATVERFVAGGARVVVAGIDADAGEAAAAALGPAKPRMRSSSLPICKCGSRRAIVRFSSRRRACFGALSSELGDTVRVVVVGASSGLGRCIGVGLAQGGAQIALLARRKDRLADAAKEAGPGSLAIECDVTDPSSCRTAIDEAAAGLGGIDGLVYTPGIGPLVRIEATDVEQWRRVFDTNVIGASLVTAAALPALRSAAGTAVYLSSVSASQTPPWPGLGAYAVSKAALDKLVDAWRAEHPDVGFTRLVVGECAGGEGDSLTEFANGWDQDLAAELCPVWIARSYMSGVLMPVERLVRVTEMVLRSGAADSIPSVIVAPRAGPQ